MSDGLSQMGNEPQVIKILNMSPFSDLALGTRFRYPMELKVWVKISHSTIAEWDEDLKACKWIGQTICSFYEDDKGYNVSGLVEVL